MLVFELTIPANTQQHLSTTSAQKDDWYSCLQYYLHLSGLYIHYISIKIGCLGHSMPNTITQVANVCKVTEKTIRSLFEQAALIAVSCSYNTLNSRASPAGIYWFA